MREDLAVWVEFLGWYNGRLMWITATVSSLNLKTMYKCGGGFRFWGLFSEAMVHGGMAASLAGGWVFGEFGFARAIPHCFGDGGMEGSFAQSTCEILVGGGGGAGFQ